MVKKSDISKALAHIGSVGGRRAASNMTPEQRAERAKNAAAKRWGGKSEKEGLPNKK